jgi:lysozyme
MIDRRTAYERIQLHEGYSKTLYKCTANKWTIGVGHNIEDNGLPDDIIYQIFKKDFRIAELEVFNYLGEYKSTIEDNRMYVLIDMCFNMGMPRLSKFNKMWKALKKDIPDYHEASKEMLDSKWARQVGDRSLRLAHCMKYGVFEQTEFERQ